jgi:hypothetical protein
MKRMVKSALGSAKVKKTLSYLLVFVLGAVGGGVVTAQLRDNNQSTLSTMQANTSTEEIAQRQAQRLDAYYKRAKEDVDQDLKAKKLTQDQANKLKAKIDEIYSYRTKDLKDTTSSEGRKKLSTKRSEWRKWAADNKLSTKYFIRLTI